MNDGTKIVVLGSGLLLLLARFFPFDRIHLVVCPLKTIAHIPCPACGMTRAFVRVMHAQWSAALHVSPLGSLLAVAAAMITIYGLLRITVLRSGIVFHVTPRESLMLRVGLVSAALVNWTYLIVSGAAA
jgi:hypothetical protein